MQKICPSCGEINLEVASFCRNCATPLGPGSAQAPSQQARPMQTPVQPFGGPMTATQPTETASSNRPLIALCLAIAGLVCCGFFTSIPGSILGWLEMSAIKQGRAPASGMTMSQIAFYGGIVVTVLAFIGLGIALLMALAGQY